MGYHSGRAGRLADNLTVGRPPVSAIGMDKTIADLNIEHYQRLLASELDATKRETIGRLLAEEEAKLAEITKKRRTSELELVDPFAPMCRPHVNPLLRFGVHPPARNPTAGEDERVMLVFVVDGEFKMAVKRCSRNGVPHEALMRP